ncbi:hypothetical protein ACMFMG_001006 [Clarireedia jacksonii]
MDRHHEFLNGEPIAIIGTSCRFPGGASSPSKLWELLRTPHDLRQDILPSRFDCQSFQTILQSKQGYFLSEDHQHFDYHFFNIPPAEAETIDPQHRLLLECVYEALESAGQSITGLQGSSTAVYTGLTGSDYANITTHDHQDIPRYAATGTHNNMISNRVSYFFDWRGPSMTIDTACSSSLVAVHLAVQALRSGEAELAIASGANLLLDPGRFIEASNLNMLSPTGRCHMWDRRADGYARGEGIAAIVMKPLRHAIRDGDYVECVIRETGVNQDGRTPGITMPSSQAQLALIEKTYRRAGLDCKNEKERCQYFEAHGTGTVGDSKEAEAVQTAFFGSEAPSEHIVKSQPLYVGSLKTVIGHSEGCAGIAGLLKASLSIQNACIPPNFAFESLHPDVQPFCSQLKIPTQLTPWPELELGEPRRASVNSFGFGGTNAHAILEQYIPPATAAQESSRELQGNVVLPFVFSSNSEQALATLLQSYAQWLDDHSTANLQELSHILHSRRSKLAIRTCLSASTIKELSSKIYERLASVKVDSLTIFGVRANSSSRQAKILGVFTGQGAHRPAMAKMLLKVPFLRRKFDFLEGILADLHEKDRPTWSLIDKLQDERQKADFQRADISQTLQAALQIVLVDLLRHAGVEFQAVVGHSSGEIAAAYTAGFLDASDAIRIAYYRGLCVQSIVTADGPKGAMITAHITSKDADTLIKLPELSGRVSIAAVSSPSSVTISGDADAISVASNILSKMGHSSRPLRVNVAYHSQHMAQCADLYREYLTSHDIRVRSPAEGAPVWYSSVDGWGRFKDSNSHQLAATYWTENLLKTVHFSQAVSQIMDSERACNLGIEIGAATVLKGAVSDILSSYSTLPDVGRPSAFPYMGVLQNDKGELESISDTLGFVWGSTSSSSSVNLDAYTRLLNIDGGFDRKPMPSKILKTLPTYPWDHNRQLWSESRRHRFFRTCAGKSHSLLGVKSPESTEDDHRWTNVLKASSVSWFFGHNSSNSMGKQRKMFPVATYISMALEASLALAAGRRIGLLTLEGIEILRPVVFEREDSQVETLVSMALAKSVSSSYNAAEFKIYASSDDDASTNLLKLVARGTVRVMLGMSTQLVSDPETVGLSDTPSHVDVDEFYHSFNDFYQGTDGVRQLLSELKWTPSGCAGVLDSLSPELLREDHSFHPAILEGMIHSVLATLWLTTSDQQWMPSSHIPTKIDYIAVNPSLSTSVAARMKTLGTAQSERGITRGSSELITRDTSQVFARLEGVTFASQAVVAKLPQTFPLPTTRAVTVKEDSPIKQKILTIDTKEAAVKHLLSAFIAYLCQALRFSEDDRLGLEDVPLIELGVDSLVALDVRSWFAKEVSFSVSVLDVLGGFSALELASNAVEKIRHLQPPSMEFPSNEAPQPSLNSYDLDSQSTSGGTAERSFVMVESPLVQQSDIPPCEWSGPLSQAQSRFWFVHSSLDGSRALNVSFYYHFTGPLRIPDLKAAVLTMGERHEALRTCYFVQDSRPMQGIMMKSRLVLEHKAISGKEDVDTEFEQLKNHIYDLHHGDIMKMLLLTESPTSNYLLFGYHHLTMDGYSFQQVFLPELEKLYCGESLSPCIRQFREHSQMEYDALQNGDLSPEIAYWKTQFQELPPVLPLFPMSRTTSRKSLSQYDYSQVELVVDAATTARVRIVAQSLQSSAFHVYVTVLQVLLTKLLDIDDFCIGIADANRVDEKDAGVIGLYLNFLPLRFQRNKEQLFSEAVKVTRKTAYSAIANSRLPFDALLKELHVPRSAKYAPLFQVFANYRSARVEKGSFADLQGRSHEVQLTKAAYDLGLDIGEGVDGKTQIVFMLQSSLYSKSDAEMIQRSYSHLLESLTLQPDKVIEEFTAYHPQDIQNALDLGRGEVIASEVPETLLHRVDIMAQSRGFDVAVKDANDSLTYAELERRSNIIAQKLLKKGLCPGDRVAVFQEPSVDWICSVLAIMRIAAIYVPLDLRNPISRLKMIISISNAAIILAHSATISDVKNLEFKPDNVVNISAVHAAMTLDSTEHTSMNNARADSPAVLLFTSGSTGTPKGITLTHASLRGAIESHVVAMRFTDREVVLQHSAYSFDISMAQIFMGISTGGTVYVASKVQRGDPVALAKLIQAEKISFFMGTSSENLAIIRYGAEFLSQNTSWKYAFCGGEPFIEALRQEFRNISLPQLRLFNAYGPAETTIAATLMEVLYQDDPLHSQTEQIGNQITSIGFPLPNYSLCVVDDNLDPVAVGVSGELLIGGSGVAIGYLENEELSRERFIPDRYGSSEFQAQGWCRLFRTGDRVRLQADGSFIFEGRVDGDTLIKLRGLRIDLGDIESTTLTAAKGKLSEVAVSLRGEPQFLVGHVVLSPTFAASDLDVDSFLEDLLLKLPLPMYMKPAILIPVDSLPMTIHGKRDRKAIATLPLGMDDEDNRLEDVDDLDSVITNDLTETEERLKNIWLAILPTEAVSARRGKKNSDAINSNTDFFAAGGNSLLLAQLQAEIKKEFDVMLPIKLLMEVCSEGLGELADMVEAAEA